MQNHTARSGKRTLPKTPDEIVRDNEGLEPVSEEDDAEVAYITEQVGRFRIETQARNGTRAEEEARQKRLLKKEAKDYALALKLSAACNGRDSDNDADHSSPEEISSSQVRDNKVVWKADKYEPAVTVGDIKETLRKIHEIMGTTSSIDITPNPRNEEVIDLTGNGEFHDEYLDIGI